MVLTSRAAWVWDRAHLWCGLYPGRGPRSDSYVAAHLLPQPHLQRSNARWSSHQFHALRGDLHPQPVSSAASPLLAACFWYRVPALSVGTTRIQSCRWLAGWEDRLATIDGCWPPHRGRGILAFAWARYGSAIQRHAAGVAGYSPGYRARCPGYDDRAAFVRPEVAIGDRVRGA